MAIFQISRIQLRRGRKNSDEGVPQLASAEMAWAVDTQELFIGNGAVSEGSPTVGNTKVLTEPDLVQFQDKIDEMSASLAAATLLIANADITAINTGDQSLQLQINDISLQITALNESTSSASLNNEKTRALLAEATISASLLVEKTRAIAAEATLTTNLNTEITRASNAELILQSNIDVESTLRANSDLNLNNRITIDSERVDTEIIRALAAESTISENIFIEKTRATNAETVLTTNLNTEITRASNAESTLADNILVEKTRAMTAEAVLTSTTNVVPGLQAILNNLHIINILDFGADNTGITSSTTAIQDAYTSLPLTGGEIIIPDGLYLLSTAVVFSGTPKSVFWNISPGASFTGAGYIRGSFPTLTTSPDHYPGGPYILSYSDPAHPTNVTSGGYSALTAEAIQSSSPDKFTVGAFIGVQGDNSSSNANVWAVRPVLNALSGAGGEYYGIEVDVNNFSTISTVKGLSINGSGTSNITTGIDVLRRDTTKYLTGVHIKNSIDGLNIDSNVIRGIVIGSPTSVPNTLVSGKQLSNNTDSIVLQRFTDVSSTGTYLKGSSTTNTEVFSISTNGIISTTGNITINNSIIGPPSFTTRSVGTKFVLYQGVSVSSADYAIGIDNSTLWNSIPTTTAQFKWYGGTTLAATLSGTGDFSITGNLSTAGVQSTAGIVSSSPTAGIGYSTGAGGAVTQLTSKATGVSLNKQCGTITMAATALAGNTTVSFTFTNSAISATDGVILNIVGSATNGGYTVGTDSISAGSCVITLRNITAGSLSEAVQIRFIVFNGTTA